MSFKLIAKTTHPNGKVVERSSVFHSSLDKIAKQLVGLTTKQAYDLKTHGRVEFEEVLGGFTYKVELTIQRISHVEILPSVPANS
jgi:hypothetical protein